MNGIQKELNIFNVHNLVSLEISIHLRSQWPPRLASCLLYLFLCVWNKNI
jgi:hypothetical protein